MAVSISAQNNYNTIYEKYSKIENVESIKIGKFLLTFSKAFIDDNSVVKLVGGLNSVSILDMSDVSSSVKESFRRDIEKFNKDGLELLADISDDSDNVKIYVLNSGNYIKQVLILDMGKDLSMICMEGKIHRNDIKKLIDSNR